jgi:hypothetical protein
MFKGLMKVLFTSIFSVNVCFSYNLNCLKYLEESVNVKKDVEDSTSLGINHSISNRDIKSVTKEKETVSDLNISSSIYSNEQHYLSVMRDLQFISLSNISVKTSPLSSCFSSLSSSLYSLMPSSSLSLSSILNEEYYYDVKKFCYTHSFSNHISSSSGIKINIGKSFFVVFTFFFYFL